MRPLHELLEAAKPYLYHPQLNNVGEFYICNAITQAADAGKLTDEEGVEAEICILEAVMAVSKQNHLPNGRSVYLRRAAISAGLIPEEWSVYTPAYIDWRDKWLDELIERLRNVQG